MARSLDLTEPPSLTAAAAAALAFFSSTCVATTPWARSAATAAGRLSASISPLTDDAPERPLYAKTAMAPPLHRQRDAQHFLDRGGPLEHLQEAGLAQRLHALALRHLADLRRGAVLEDHVPQLLRDDHHLVQRHPALHAGEVTSLTALALIEGDFSAALGDVAVRHQVVLVALEGLLAILADLASKSLRQNEEQRRGQQEGLDSHVHEPGHGGRAVVGVQRGENQVAGEGGPDGDLGVLQTAGFTDEDELGVWT